MSTMKIESLGHRTDVMIAGWHAEIKAKAHYIVIRTPTNTSYHWGNFLIMDAPPGPDSYAPWLGAFDAEISRRQDTHHVAIAWNAVHGEAGDVSAFLERGFELERSVVLTTEALTPPARPNTEAVIRALVTDEDWAQACENQISCRDDIFTEANYREFKVPQMRNYRGLSEQGKGDWYGAFLGDRLVADLGVFHDGELGRYQSVGTHPDFRRQGLCGTLVYRAGLDVMARHGVTHLVMEADPDAPACSIYQSVGFAITEHICALYRRDLEGRS